MCKQCFENTLQPCVHFSMLVRTPSTAVTVVSPCHKPLWQYLLPATNPWLTNIKKRPARWYLMRAITIFHCDTCHNPFHPNSFHLPGAPRWKELGGIGNLSLSSFPLHSTKCALRTATKTGPAECAETLNNETKPRQMIPCMHKSK